MALKDKDTESHLKESNTFQKQAGEVLGEEFWQDIAGLIPRQGPSIDIYYTSTSVVVLAEIPGLDSPDQIGIYLEGQTLIVEGEIPRIYPVTDNRITLNERFFGSFRRSLQMPKPVSINDISAKYVRGLLVVELRIEDSVQQMNIPIQFS